MVVIFPYFFLIFLEPWLMHGRLHGDEEGNVIFLTRVEIRPLTITEYCTLSQCPADELGGL